jgi:hypothetical protein
VSHELKNFLLLADLSRNLGNGPHTQGIEMWITMAGLFQFENIMKVHGEKAGI